MSVSVVSHGCAAFKVLLFLVCLLLLAEGSVSAKDVHVLVNGAGLKDGSSLHFKIESTILLFTTLCI
jgi:hypothetical protein